MWDCKRGCGVEPLHDKDAIVPRSEFREFGNLVDNIYVRLSITVLGANRVMVVVVYPSNALPVA